jgi:hypothetical protein
LRAYWVGENRGVFLGERLGVHRTRREREGIQSAGQGRVSERLRDVSVAQCDEERLRVGGARGQQQRRGQRVEGRAAFIVRRGHSDRRSRSIATFALPGGNGVHGTQTHC